MPCFSVVSVAETTHHRTNSFLWVVAGYALPTSSSLHFDTKWIVVRSSLTHLADPFNSFVAVIAGSAESESGVVCLAEITDREAQTIEEEVPVNTLNTNVVPDPLAVGFVFVGIGH